MLMKLGLCLYALVLGTNTLSAEEGPNKKLTGKIIIDGSSTVYPISEAMAEEFGKSYPKVKVTVGVSGTGGGFKRFTTGETDISNASRPIKPSEIEAAKKHSVEYFEFPVAYDGLSVVVNGSNTFVKSLTVAQLNLLWKPDSKVMTWNQLDPSWPNEKIKLYGPGTDSGTFDYFTEVINGKSQVSRADYTKSEDDNVLVNGIKGDKNALGYFGYAYYDHNKKGGKINLVGIDSGDGKIVSPSEETIKNGTYKPLSRPLFIYISKKAAAREDVQAFMKFFVDQADMFVKDTGYVPLTKTEYENTWKKFAEFSGLAAKKS